MHIHTLELNELPNIVIDALLALANREGLDIVEDMGVVFSELDLSNVDERILGDFLVDNYKSLIPNTIFEFSS